MVCHLRDGWAWGGCGWLYLQQKEFIYFCIGVLDQGAEHGFPPQIGADEEMRVWQEATGSAELRNGAIRLREQRGELPVHGENRRQRRRMEGMVTLRLRPAVGSLLRLKVFRQHVSSRCLLR